MESAPWGEVPSTASEDCISFRWVDASLQTISECFAGPKIIFDNKTEVEVVFTRGTGAQVFSDTFRIVLPVPVEAGVPLVYPAGHPNAGEPIVDWCNNTIGDNGLIFWNYKDKAWQAVPSDGQGVILFNGGADGSPVTREQWAQFRHTVMEVAGEGGDVMQLTLAQVQEILVRANEQGLGDRYNSDRTRVRSHLIEVDAPRPYYGLYRRDESKICYAVYIVGSGSFQGPAASEQKFTGSAVIVDCDDNEGPHVVQWDSFVNNYRIEGRQHKIDPSDLPTYTGPRRHDEHRRQGRRRVAAERECMRA